MSCAWIQMWFQYLRISTAKESESSITLLSNIHTITIILYHFLDRIHQSFRLFDICEEFLLVWTHHDRNGNQVTCTYGRDYVLISLRVKYILLTSRLMLNPPFPRGFFVCLSFLFLYSSRAYNRGFPTQFSVTFYVQNGWFYHRPFLHKKSRKSRCKQTE